MHATGYSLVLIWVLTPPILFGVSLLVALWMLSSRSGKRSLWGAVLLLIALSTLISIALVAFGPDWFGRHIGIRDIEVFGVQTIWAPFAFIAAALAFPFAAWWAKRGRAVGLNTSVERGLPAASAYFKR